MSSNNLIIDFSEEYIAMHCMGINYLSELRVSQFFEDTDAAIGALVAEIGEKGFVTNQLMVSIPLVCINHQIVSLPDNVSEKEKMVFLGLEINKALIGPRFGIQRLAVTKRMEGEAELCDYLILAPKQEVYAKFELLAKELNAKLESVVPSFSLIGAEKINELRATAWVGEDRSEVIVWGLNNPLAVTFMENSGDQIGDINRFIVDYFDHVDGLSLSMIYLYGPRMRDSALGFGLTYPHQIFDDPTKYLFERIYRAPQQMNIAEATKLPKPPIAWTPRNLTFVVTALAACLLLFFTFFNQAQNFRLKAQLNMLERKEGKMRKTITKYKQLEKEEAKLVAEKDFYLSITKRRTPWQKILADLSKLTPKDLWFERLNASKNKMLVSGRAKNTEQVTSLSININNNSRYLKDALILGTRDYEENSHTYSEFQLSTKLKSPSGKYSEYVN